ncbi:MAG: isoaspartyl peptidase/L-asparaginase [Hyphomonas sp.]|jgi:beta-aspartyl-peptidase (threonine type)|uniref:isoaspartyl peptidase/L-asparaginase family protein n=1 Tax=Hyphomonas sp. TaxID=87 RepID=UPI001AFFA9C7|nr:isoaspartyl peptidase/L-asparaginase [Hyphomonas sp.]MBO6582455.1 isoaspartyl peptidase/L-asparaginase [Hyphomonas sp.]MDF1807427.1 isoaspartyl peptidase/L-asparaginase [Hyphomonas sp.]
MNFRKLVIAAAVFLGACAATSDPGPTMTEWRLVIHGGAGVITREGMSPEKEAAYTAALETALEAGAAVLRNGGSALDAVEAAVIPMENDPLFNSGYGAVFTAAGTHELDASIMDGRNRNAGAVAGVTRVRNPIKAARAVMDKSEHVMFAGSGADAFAEAQGLDMVDNSYFDTDRRRQSLERVLEERVRTAADRHGTVGAVAIDQDGNLAAATTTGGMTAKAAGRIGDSPLIGAATYAENGVCAVSATGHGEYFIRVGVAKTICDRVKLAGDGIEAAAESALAEVAELGGDGGVIVLDGDGGYAFVFNSEGMYRGVVDASGARTAIYGGE